MKIPRYDQQVGAPSAPQFSRIADVRTDNLSGLADTLKDVYADKLKEQEEAKKTAIFQADTSIKMATTQAMFDMEERIKNGGSYANAEAEYQKAHDQAFKEFGSAFDADESGNTKARALAEYQAEGLSNVLRIRQMVSSRRRSDAASAANLRNEQLSQQAITATDEEYETIKQNMISNIASATSATGENPATGKSQIMKVLQDTNAKRLEIFRQNNINNPSATLAKVESEFKNKNITPEVYITERGQAMASIARLKKIEASYIDLEGNGGVTGPQSDLIMEDVENTTGAQFGSDQHAEALSNVSTATGKIPPATLSKIQGMLIANPDDIRNEDAVVLARYAMALKKTPSLAFAKMPESDQVMMNIISDQVSNGANPVETVKMALNAKKVQEIKENPYSFVNKDDAKDYLTDALDRNNILQKIPFAARDVKVTQGQQEEFDGNAAVYIGAGKQTFEAYALAFEDMVEKYSVKRSEDPKLDKFVEKENKLVREMSPVGPDRLRTLVDSASSYVFGTDKSAFAPNGEMRRFFEQKTQQYYNGSGGKYSLEKAQDMALSDTLNTWTPYNGEMIKYGPKILGFSDKEFSNNVVAGTLKDAGVYNEQYKYHIGSDQQTASEYNINPSKITYPIYMEVNGVRALATKTIVNESGQTVGIMPLRTKPVKRKSSANIVDLYKKVKDSIGE